MSVLVRSLPTPEYELESTVTAIIFPEASTDTPASLAALSRAVCFTPNNSDIPLTPLTKAFKDGNLDKSPKVASAAADSSGVVIGPEIFDVSTPLGGSALAAGLTVDLGVTTGF